VGQGRHSSALLCSMSVVIYWHFGTAYQFCLQV